MSPITIEPLAMAVMAAHAQQHSHEAVYGYLLGQKNRVTAAAPVSHGPPPSKVLVETSLAWLAAASPTNQAIVGWYTAPALIDDTRAGPVSLRIVAGLEAVVDHDPVLVVLNNQVLQSWKRSGVAPSAPVAQAYGKDFGQQYMQKLETSVEKESSVASLMQGEVMGKDSLVVDWLTHLEGDDPSLEWSTNQAKLREMVQRYCK